MRGSSFPPQISSRQVSLAARSFEHKYGRKPDRFDTLSWLAEGFVASGNLEPALACFEQIPTSAPLYGHSARHQQGQILLQLDRAREAELNFKEFLEAERTAPQATQELIVDAQQRLRYLLEIELRFEERHALLAEMVGAGSADAFDTLAFCFPNLLRWNGPVAVERLEKLSKVDPGDYHLRIALGRQRTGQGRLEEALEILDRCHEERAGDLTAAAALLACLQSQDEWGRMAQIFNQLPPPKDDDPWLLLLTRGHIENHFTRYVEAIDCFQRMLRAEPACPEAQLGLATAYAALQQHDLRQSSAEKASLLSRIQHRLGWATSRPDDTEPLVEISGFCKQAGLHRQSRIIDDLVRKLQTKAEKADRLATSAEDQRRNIHPRPDEEEGNPRPHTSKQR